MSWHANLESSRDDPEEVGHDVRDEQVRVDCVSQAAEVPGTRKRNRSRIAKTANNVVYNDIQRYAISPVVLLYIRTLARARGET